MSKVYHAAQQDIVQLPLFVLSKVCSRCNTEKPLEQFGIARGCRDGRRSYCNVCKFKQDKIYRDTHHEQIQAYFDTNREQIREKDKAYKASPRGKQKRRANRVRSIEKARQRGRNYYAQNAESIREQRKDQYRADPQKALNYSRERKARLKKASTDTINYDHILERDGYFCYICEQPIDPTVKEGPGSLAFDHVIPLSPRKGEPKGDHAEDNLKPTHKVCNNRKHNRRFEDMNAIQRRGVTE